MTRLYFERIVPRASACLSLLLLAASVHGQPRLSCGIRKSPPERLRVPRTVSQQSFPAANTQATPVVIDAMFLYSRDAVNGAGNESVLRARLQEAISEANYLYTNS